MSEALRKRRILIIDDDKPGAEARKLQLEARGFEVLLAPSVRAAKEMLAEEVFDLTICDWMLPDGQGDEVVRFIKAFSPDVPCIVHSAFESSDGQATGAGATEFVLKGTHPDALLNAVSRGLALETEQMTNDNATSSAAFSHRLAEILRASLDLPDRCEAPTCVELGNRVDYTSIIPVMHLWAGRGRTHVLDCSRQTEPEESMVSWFGKVDRRQQDVVGFLRGALEYRKDDLVVVRHWELASRKLADAVCQSLRDGFLTRLGARTRIPVISRVVLFLEADSPTWRERSDFAQIVSTRWYHLQNHMVGQTPMWNFTKSLFELYQNSYRRMSRATRMELMNLPPSITLANIQRALECAEQNASDKVEPEDIDLNVLENRVIKNPSGDLGTIAEARDAMEAYYVRRVLSECGGNVAEAAKLANVKRQMIYNYIKKYNISLADFQTETTM